MYQAKVHIVLLYGIYYPEREHYGEYLDRVAKELHKVENPTVVLCGGITDPGFPGMSEAESARDYLETKGVKANWLLEGASLTTYQNLANAAVFLINQVDDTTNYVVFCDNARKAKASWLAMHLLVDMPTKEAYVQLVQYSSRADFASDFVVPRLQVVGMEYETGAIPANIEQTYSTIRDIVLLDHPELEGILTEVRRREFGLT